MCRGTWYSGLLPRCVVVDLYSDWSPWKNHTNTRSFQSWPHCTCTYGILNHHGLHTLHPAVRQRAKEDGCHEGSQHWFLQAKPLAQVMPGHLLLLVGFQSVRCPFQTEHHHLKNNKKDSKVLRHVYSGLGCFIIMVVIKCNYYNTTIEGAFGCLDWYQYNTCYYINWLLNPYCNSYQLWACHHGCWCGCWLHSSGSHAGHVGWSLRGWRAGELGESGQWESCACPVGTYGHRWSGFLQQGTESFSYSCSIWGNI